ncbi:MAG: hypothetical protein GY941_11080 [Planctomycetes bacterium]|nr:hypothetical protein [Planctomycetota bacterium]
MSLVVGLFYFNNFIIKTYSHTPVPAKTDSRPGRKPRRKKEEESKSKEEKTKSHGGAEARRDGGKEKCMSGAFMHRN